MGRPAIGLRGAPRGGVMGRRAGLPRLRGGTGGGGTRPLGLGEREKRPGSGLLFLGGLRSRGLAAW